MAVALVDAALRKGGSVADRLQRELIELDGQLTQRHQQMQALVARTKADFERMET
jgi:alpha-D-ribose 1-methylphosphonate 5-triphosphate synthase subunit PhnG